MYDTKKLETFILYEMQDKHIPGSMVAIFDSNKVLFKEVYGYNDINKKYKLNINDRFPIGSCGKNFLATAFLNFFGAQKKLELKTPISSYFNEINNNIPENAKNLTIEDILANRTNISKSSFLWDYGNFSREELFYKLRFLDTFNNHSNYINYNNLMFTIGEYILEKLTKQTYENYVQETIFSKLKMTDTKFDSVIKQKRNIHTYRFYDNIYHEIDYLNHSSELNDNILYSSICDLIHWVQQYLRHNGLELNCLSLENCLKMITPHTIAYKEKNLFTTNLNNVCSNLFYGLGWFVQYYKGQTLIFHQGKVLGHNILISFMPSYDKGVIIYTNSEHDFFHSILMYYIYDTFLGNISNWHNFYYNLPQRKFFFSKQKISENTLSLINHYQYIGEYKNSLYGIITVKDLNGILYLIYKNLHTRLYRIEKDTFLAIPIDEFTCYKNRLGINNSLRIKFENKNLKIENDTNLNDISFINQGIIV